MLPDESFIYGKRNKPATPVTNVLANYYGETAGLALKHQYLEQAAMKRNAGGSLTKIRMTHC